MADRYTDRRRGRKKVRRINKQAKKLELVDRCGTSHAACRCSISVADCYDCCCSCPLVSMLFALQPNIFYTTNADTMPSPFSTQGLWLRSVPSAHCPSPFGGKRSRPQRSLHTAFPPSVASLAARPRPWCRGPTLDDAAIRGTLPSDFLKLPGVCVCVCKHAVLDPGQSIEAALKNKCVNQLCDSPCADDLLQTIVK